MQIGIIVQTFAITAITLTAYLIGLEAHPEQPEFAETMAFVALSFSELLRAFTARSEIYPIFRIGIFSNRSMNWAVVSSLILLLAVVYIPFLQPVFDTVPIGWMQWLYLLPLLFLPALAAELTKWLLALRRDQAASAG